MSGHPLNETSDQQFQEILSNVQLNRSIFENALNEADGEAGSHKFRNLFETQNVITDSLLTLITMMKNQIVNRRSDIHSNGHTHSHIHVNVEQGDQGGIDESGAASATNGQVIPRSNDHQPRSGSTSQLVTASKDADRITLKSLPKYSNYEGWRDNALASIVCSSGNPSVASSWVEDVARKTPGRPDIFQTPLPIYF